MAMNCLNYAARWGRITATKVWLWAELGWAPWEKKILHPPPPPPGPMAQVMRRGRVGHLPMLSFDLIMLFILCKISLLILINVVHFRSSTFLGVLILVCEQNIVPASWWRAYCFYLLSVNCFFEFTVSWKYIDVVTIKLNSKPVYKLVSKIWTTVHC